MKSALFFWTAWTIVATGGPFRTSDSAWTPDRASLR